MAAFDTDTPFLIVDPINEFGDENATLDDDPDWSTAYFDYTGGSAASLAIPQSIILGEIVIERFCEPFNVCSGAIGKPRTGAAKTNSAY